MAIFKHLSKDAELLVKKIQAGEDIDENFDKLVVLFTPIKKAIISNLKKPPIISYEDLDQEANLSLWTCCNKYDFKSGCSFYSYYYRCATNRLCEYIYKNQSSVSVSKHERERNKDLRTFCKKFFDDTGDYPKIEDYIKNGFEKKRAEDFCKLSMAIYEESQQVEDSMISFNTFEEDLVDAMDAQRVVELIDNLEYPKKEIITMRYLQKSSYAEIASKLKFCQRTIKKYEAAALKELRNMLKWD